MLAANVFLRGHTLGCRSFVGPVDLRAIQAARSDGANMQHRRPNCMQFGVRTHYRVPSQPQPNPLPLPLVDPVLAIPLVVPPLVLELELVPLPLPLCPPTPP